MKPSTFEKKLPSPSVSHGEKKKLRWMDGNPSVFFSLLCVLLCVVYVHLKEKNGLSRPRRRREEPFFAKKHLALPLGLSFYTETKSTAPHSCSIFSQSTSFFFFAACFFFFSFLSSLLREVTCFLLRRKKHQRRRRRRRKEEENKRSKERRRDS